MKRKLPPARTSAGISILDWMKSKPYSTSTSYDRAFLPLCNDVFHLLNERKDWFDSGEVDRELRKELACMLVSYFEDFVSEIFVLLQNAGLRVQYQNDDVTAGEAVLGPVHTIKLHR
ncbi:MAG: DUF3843 family protein, partial [Bacteroidota bacterium]